jgi:Outer membrane protein beta-barrel domain
MKQILLALVATGLSMSALAQTDSTSNERVDTIKVGGMIIIKKRNPNDTSDHEVTIHKRHDYKPSNITTNWAIFDLGFANYQDNTNYASAAAQQIAPGATDKDALSLRTGKSVDVNIWFFMQRLNLIAHVVNLKYGLGLELNNYSYDRDLVFQKNPTVILPASADLKKSKLAVDYVTVPMLLNFNLTPKRNDGFGFSAGVSAGYLYSARYKNKDGHDDKHKVRDNFDLEKWKLSYIGELNLGVVKLYGSYAFKNMWEKGLDQQPYNFGIRFSHW